MKLTALTTLCLILACTTRAQDFSLDPYYGTSNLTEGFEDDPLSVPIAIGGDINLSSIPEIDCPGFIANAPDYRLNYTSESRESTLSIFAISSADTVLVVSDPYGRWHCNDDYSEEFGLSAGLDFENPISGNYDIWAGVYDEDQRLTSGELIITELAYLLDELVSDQDSDSFELSNASNGTAFLIGNSGHLVTNFHVVEGCTSLSFRLPGRSAVEATLISSNEQSDLALLETDLNEPALSIEGDSSIKLGEEVVVFGFPLLGDLSSQGNLTNGVVSALTGLNDDLMTFQLSAQIQPGNSGGPVFNSKGNLIGVVVGIANNEYFERSSGTIPQNVNFAIRSSVLKTFLDSNNIQYQTASGSNKKAISDIAEAAQKSTGALYCY